MQRWVARMKQFFARHGSLQTMGLSRSEPERNDDYELAQRRRRDAEIEAEYDARLKRIEDEFSVFQQGDER